ncbi:MAG: Eco57I restriction-modification methylase domain-containing protein [Methylococcaceae bacterium]
MNPAHNIKQSLNPAFAKLKPQLIEIEQFSKHALELINSISIDESEEFHKNCLSDFLKTLYSDNYINTNERNDLVIHNDKTANSSVAVIIETKKPSNKAEMLFLDNLNKKALQQLLFYYLCERVNHNNLQLKYLIATNNDDWFIFDAQLFERLFYNDKTLIKQFKEFQQKASSGNTTEFFYKNIAQPAIAQAQTALEYTYFNLSEFKTALENTDNSIITLFKFLSPQHLLKQAFVNDGNSLNKEFYNELLHIIGLTEVAEKGKKLIKRKIESERDAGSLLEKAIAEIISLDKLSRISQLKHYGNTHEEQLFNIGLELCITWINRVLFLRLLEAQLLVYHADNKDYAFLNSEKLENFADLNDLFFKVLACQTDGRSKSLQQRFAHIPYLNSSLFEQTQLEHETIFISQLSHRELLPLLPNTVLKDELGKKHKGEKDTLKYLFAFLNAYNFASDETKALQEDNKQLINAAVLGLIFEKINGYQDGSFFTPSFITMTMSRESLRRAVLQKFNEIKQWNCQNFDELYNKIDNISEANTIINSLKICDPAVGSGHFLVSVLNEIIAIKSELKILCDRQGWRLKEYSISIINDELEIRDEEGELFFYKPTSKESQRVQEALFHEKQTIIEQCLFGVDINANSVAICRLRLWIELLKNAYYLNDGSKRLETLPNIDINIKCGNSLISRFALDADLKTLLSKHKVSIEAYKKAFHDYQNAQSKEEKRALEQFITGLKNHFIKGLHDNSAEKKNLSLLVAKRDSLTQVSVFEETLKDKKEREKQLKKLELDINKASELLDNLESKLYEKAFEWRFEFPEALNNDGDFIGFDVIIGNPPYISHDRLDNKNHFKSFYNVYEPFNDIYSYFFELGVSIVSKKGELSFITSNSFLKAEYGKPLRDFLLKNGEIIALLNLEDTKIFQEATVNTCILSFCKENTNKKALVVNAIFNLKSNFDDFISKNYFYYYQNDFNTQSWGLSTPEKLSVFKKIQGNNKTLADFKTQINLGIATGSNNVFVLNSKKCGELIKADANNQEILKPILRGKDIRRYGYEIPDLKIILSRNEIDVKKDYPKIYDYLDSMGDDFKHRGAKGKHWTNLRACSFFDDFKKEKIVWLELTDVNKFALCTEEVYLLNSAYFLIPPKELSSKFLLAVLNSKVIYFYLSLIANTSGVGTTRWINTYVKEFPIAMANDADKLEIETLVDEILANKKAGKETSELEQQIDKLVYALYDLTSEEISIIEGK